MTKKQPPTPVECWIQIDTEVRAPWVTAIWGEYHNARKAAKLPPIPPDLSELAIHLSTRLDMLPHVFKRVGAEAEAIYDNTRNAPNKNRARVGRKAIVFPLPRKLKYEFLLDVDSLLFELNSSCELMSSFLQHIHELAGESINKDDVGERVRQIVQGAGQDTEWFTTLANHRHLFIHEAAPWFAVDITDESCPDILIMKENLSDFSDEDRFLRLSTLRKVVDGFAAAIQAIQEHLVRLLSNLAASR